MEFICSKGKAYKILKLLPVLFLFIMIFTFILQPVRAEAEERKIEVNYFYISACSSCRDAENYLSELSDHCSPRLDDKNIKLQIYKFNTAENENLNLLQEYLKKYNVPEKDQDLPIVFFGNKYIAGEKAIKAQLEKELLSIEPGDAGINVVKSGSNSAVEKFNGVKALTTFVVGFGNGLTPCSLSMLLFFISLIIARDVSVIKMGLLYCAGKFITYFFLGTMLFKTLGSINTEWLDFAVKIIMLTAILIFICLNAMDFVAAKSERYDRIKLQLPTKLRGFNHKWIKVVSGVDNPGTLICISFLLGIVTSVGEFLCTGQIYLTTILYVLHSQKELNTKAFLYFLEYNVAFVAPLLIITFLIYKGKEVFDVSEFIRRNMHCIKLINILIFAALGLFLLFSL